MPPPPPWGRERSRPKRRAFIEGGGGGGGRCKVRAAGMPVCHSFASKAASSWNWMHNTAGAGAHTRYNTHIRVPRRLQVPAHTRVRVLDTGCARGRVAAAACCCSSMRVRGGIVVIAVVCLILNCALYSTSLSKVTRVSDSARWQEALSGKFLQHIGGQGLTWVVVVAVYAFWRWFEEQALTRISYRCASSDCIQLHPNQDLSRST